MNQRDIYKRTIFGIRDDVIICLFLVLLTLAVFFQIRHHEFLNWDDPLYITENRHVNTGLKSQNIVWSFFSQLAGNWHPITWLSHMADVQLYGMDPGRHHLTNLLIHVANTLLLFLVFNRMTGKLWQSGFVAALFALHPLHVESVAWASERKDVLSTFWGMLTLCVYVAYTERPSLYRYAWVVVCLILGLMAKPMLVTLPFLLLLLDYWPLGRYQDWDIATPAPRIQYPFAKLFYEKIPLFLCAATSSVITFIVQQSSGAVGTFDKFPFASRVSNAMISYVAYIGKMFWPSNLAFFYPHPIVFPWWQVAVSGLTIVSISFLAFTGYRRYPWFVVGWLWYVITLIPVIGFVQVGLQAMADRYTYVPLIGLFVIISWFVPERLSRWRHREFILSSLVAVVLTFLLITTWRQVGYWKNNITLNSHAINVTGGNYTAHNNLGVYMADQGNTQAAIHHFAEALKMKPDFVFACNNIGAVLAAEGRLSEAVKQYNKALDINPLFECTHNNLGLVLVKQGKIEEAIHHYNEALNIRPNFVEAHNNLGVLLLEQGRTGEAAKHFAEALRIDPLSAGAHNNLAKTLEEKGKTSEAIYHYIEAVRIDSDFVEAHYNLGMLLLEQGRLKDAENSFRQMLRVDPDNTKGRYNLDKILEKQEEINASIAKIKEKLKLYPKDSSLNYQLGNLYKINNEMGKAIDQYKEALSTHPRFVSALNGLAIAYAIKGQYDKGLSFLRQSIEYKPENAETYYYIASIYARQTKIEQSIEWLKKALQRGYNNWDRIKADSNLENIRHLSEYKMLVKDH